MLFRQPTKKLYTLAQNCIRNQPCVCGQTHIHSGGTRKRKGRFYLSTWRRIRRPRIVALDQDMAIDSSPRRLELPVWTEPDNAGCFLYCIQVATAVLRGIAASCTIRRALRESGLD